ncbi:MAG: type II toxin-antitoxin system ParD family antitoxin [Pseudomonadota bacterium]
MSNMRDKEQIDTDLTGEAPRAGPHSPEDHELRMERLRAALREGEVSGDPMPFDMEQFIAEKKQKR